MTDYLIIGQGLAGSLLAWELIQRGCRVTVVDNGQENASLIAAGLINPVTGMRFVKSHGVDTLLPAATQCYSRLADCFRQAFYIEKTMLRLFRDAGEIKHAEKRLSQPDYRPYLGAIDTARNVGNILTPFGFLEQKQTGYLLTEPLLTRLREYFIANNSYRQTAFDYRELQTEPCLRWRDQQPKRIVFCEGYRAAQNPWFGRLPFQAVKGEILTLEHRCELPDRILNGGHWLVPLTSGRCRVGATFDRKTLNGEITEAGKKELISAMHNIAPVLSTAAVVKQQANVRPCTQDKLPFIGLHPHQPQLAIFNGFGAKGSLQIPFYSRCFADFLLNGSGLPRSCDIRRYDETYFSA